MYRDRERYAPCIHVRPVEMDERIEQSEDGEEEEIYPEVLALHPEAHDQLHDPERDSALINMLKTNLLRVDEKQQQVLV